MPETHPQLNLKAVADFMDARGVDSTSELARLTGIERTYLSRVLRGLRPAQPSHILAIASALQVSPLSIRHQAVTEEAA